MTSTSSIVEGLIPVGAERPSGFLHLRICRESLGFDFIYMWASDPGDFKTIASCKL